MSNARKAWLKGLASGFLICFILFIWAPEPLFGERKRYTETFLRLNDNPPGVSSLLLDGSSTNLDIPHRNFDPDAPEVSLFKISPVFSLKPSMVRSVCIARAELEFEGTETWVAHIRLKEPDALLAAAHVAGIYDDPNNRPFGLIKFGERAQYSSHNITVSRFRTEASMKARDTRQLPYDFAISFNEMYVPDVSEALLALSPDYKVLPCPTLQDLTVYNRWRTQWTDGEPGVVTLAPGWSEKYR